MPIHGNEQTEGELVATANGRVPPGPRGSLLLGSIPEIRRDNVHAFLGAWRRHCDTVRFRVLQLPLVVAMVAQRYRLSLLPARPAEVEAGAG